MIGSVRPSGSNMMDLEQILKEPLILLEEKKNSNVTTTFAILF